MSDLISLYSPSISLHQSEKMHEIGKKLYQQNKNYKSLVNCLEHPEFREFFDNNFSDKDSIKTILIYMKLYQQIEKMSPVELNGYQKIAIVDKAMKNSDFRQRICHQAANITL